MTDLSILFESFDLGALRLANRIVMAPLIRMKSPQQVPREAEAAYYAHRAAGSSGPIISEGPTIQALGADSYADIPVFDGTALAGLSQRRRSGACGREGTFSRSSATWACNARQSIV